MHTHTYVYVLHVTHCARNTFTHTFTHMCIDMTHHTNREIEDYEDLTDMKAHANHTLYKAKGDNGVCVLKKFTYMKVTIK